MTFRSEAELCRAFARLAEGDGWDVWPEVGGWDLVLVATASTRTKTLSPHAKRAPKLVSIPEGSQVGIEAKLAPSVQQVHQARQRMQLRQRPDFGVLLVPHVPLRLSRRTAPVVDLWRDLAGALGLTLHTMGADDTRSIASLVLREAAPEQLPLPPVKARLDDAGTPNPRAVTDWRVRALRLILRGEAQGGYLTRQDFVAERVAMARWVTRRWIVSDGLAGRVTRYRLDPTAPGYPLRGWESEAAALRQK